ncbi:MAG: Gfo/Idh/MocA family oxidoreductase [Acidobacteriales bacterium]|nr:Gfo/Idh/MocA family oxidoreductase [Terriglobales bacterium]
MSLSHSQPFRVALLGAGNIATTHVAALQNVEGTDIVAVCDVDEARARALQIKGGSALIFRDLETMLTRAKPDAVHVLLPPAMHARATEACLAAGCHVFVEKPFCISAAECRRVWAAGERARRQIGVDHNLVFMPPVIQLIDDIHAFRFGAIKHVHVVYNLPLSVQVGVRPTHWMFAEAPNLVLELGIHPLSLICRLVGRVRAASTVVSGEVIIGNGVRFFKTWASSMVCERGTAQLLLSTDAEFTETSAHVIGQDSVAYLDFRRNTFRRSGSTPFVRFDNLADGWRGARALFSQSLRNAWSTGRGMLGSRIVHSTQVQSVQNSLSDFYGAVRCKRSPLIGAAQGTTAVEACEFVVNSAMSFLAQNGRSA